MAAPFRFGRFEIQPDTRRLLDGGVPVALGQRGFDLLLALVERRERLVSKGELLDVVWPGVVVEENNLQVQVSALRKLLGPQAIATIPGRGYRFASALDGSSLGTTQAHVPEPTPAPRTNIPADLPPLYGREADLAALRELLAGHRLVTVVGAGGIGKSRLAQRVAQQVASTSRETWMIELAGLSDPALVARTVGQPLGIQAERDEDLAAALATRRALLVLDNCEHLLHALASLAHAVLAAAPGIAILATSQEPLHLPAEQQYRILPLAIPTGKEDDARSYGALALFEARVRATDSRFTLTGDNLSLAIDVCRRLDGLPLAIELAAGRAATLGLRQLRDKLDARFKLLTGGSRHTLRRHQTLRAALEWSYNLLDDEGRTVFRRLGAFVGGFTVELAQAVARDGELDDWRVLDILALLADKSLVSVDPGDAPRYRLLESARAFALEMLGEAEQSEALRRHSHAMRDFIVAVDDRNMDGELRTDQYAALVVPELDNLRAARVFARENGDVATECAIAAYSGSLIDYAGECMNWLLDIDEEAVEGLPDPCKARYFRALAAINMAGHVSNSRQKAGAQRAAALYRVLGQPRREFSALMRLGAKLSVEGDSAAAAAMLAPARALVRPDWPPEFHILLLRREAAIARRGGRYADARTLIEESIRVCTAARDWRLEVMARTSLCDLLWATAPLHEALALTRALDLELRQRPAAPGDLDVHHTMLLGMCSEAGDLDGALVAAREALSVITRTRTAFFDQWVHLFCRLGHHELAARVMGASDSHASFRYTNEERLLAQVKPVLTAAIAPDRLAALHAEGAALSVDATYALLREGLDSHQRG